MITPPTNKEYPESPPSAAMQVLRLIGAVLERIVVP